MTGSDESEPASPLCLQDMNPFISYFKLSVCPFIGLLMLLLLFVLPFQSFAQSDSDGNQRIYATNQGSASVTVIDAVTLEVVDTVDLTELGFSAMARPHHAIAEPDGSHWYVTLIGENRVLKFTRDNELVEQAELEVPGLMAMAPESGKLFVGRSMSAVNPPQSFAEVNLDGMTVQEEVDLFFTRPHAIAVTPGEEWIYVSSLSSNQILARNIETGEADLISIDGDTHVFINFAISPDGSTMVLTGQVSGDALIFDLSDPMAPSLTDVVDVNPMPWHPVFSPDGKFVYFANKGSNTVTVLNMDSRTVDAVIEGNGLAQPHGAALSADGRYLFVTSNNRNGSYRPEGVSEDETDLPGTVTVIDTEKREIVKVIEVGRNATGIGTGNW
jgi:YVTN family beta-propeller protein